MSKFSNSAIRQIKAAIRLEKLVEETLGAPRIECGDHVWCCPFHTDRTPSFKVNLEGQFFKCFGCGVNGDVFDYYSQMNKCSLADTVLRLGERVNIRMDGSPNPILLKPLLQQPSTVARKAPLRIFATMDEVVKFVTTSFTGKDDIVTRYSYGELSVFRLDFLKGKKRFLQVRAVDGGFSFGTPSSLLPAFKADELNGAKDVLVLEGEKCVLKAIEYGFTATTSSGGSGAAHRTDWQLLGGRVVTLWPDNDEPGMKYAAKVTEILQELTPRPRIRTVNPEIFGLPSGGDICDFVKEFEAAGKTRDEIRAGIQAVLDRATEFGVVAELHRELEDAINGTRCNLSTPFPILDQHVNGLIPTGIVLLGGQPGSTKSFVALQIVRHWVNSHVPCAMLLLENDITHCLRRALAQICANSHVTYDKWCRDNAELLRIYQKSAGNELRALAEVLTVLPDNVSPTYDVILDWIEQQLTKGARVVVIDPITAMQSSAQPWNDHSKFIWGAKRMVSKAKASLFCVTHPVGQAGAKHVPGLDDIAGGKSFIRFSQTVMLLQAYDTQQSSIKGLHGVSTGINNRTIAVWKSNNGYASRGMKFLYMFDQATLLTKEIGIENA